jgi:hypothetical protein
LNEQWINAGLGQAAEQMFSMLYLGKNDEGAYISYFIPQAQVNFDVLIEIQRLSDIFDEPLEAVPYDFRRHISGDLYRRGAQNYYRAYEEASSIMLRLSILHPDEADVVLATILSYTVYINTEFPQQSELVVFHNISGDSGHRRIIYDASSMVDWFN